MDSPAAPASPPRPAGTTPRAAPEVPPDDQPVPLTDDHPAEATVQTGRRSRRLPPPTRALAEVLIRPSFWAEAVPVQNLSCHGSGLLIDRPVKVGAAVAPRLRRDGKEPPPALLARVVHATPLEKHVWLLGREFRTPLRPGDVAASL